MKKAGAPTFDMAILKDQMILPPSVNPDNIDESAFSYGDYVPAPSMQEALTKKREEIEKKLEEAKAVDPKKLADSPEDRKRRLQA